MTRPPVWSFSPQPARVRRWHRRSGAANEPASATGTTASGQLGTFDIDAGGQRPHRMFGFRVHGGALGVAGIVADSVAFGIMVSVVRAWIALRLRDAEKAQRVLFIPMAPVAFISSAFGPASHLPTGCVKSHRPIP
jgi:hypothetical protein